MSDMFIKWFMTLNVFLIHISGGRLGSQLGTQTILILHSVGRKTGRMRTIPVAYFDYQDKYLLVASNWGKDKQAGWYVNLKEQPQATIEVNGRTIKVMARIVHGDEYMDLWKFATEKHPPYLNYQKKTTRQIPIVILDPLA